MKAKRTMSMTRFGMRPSGLFSDCLLRPNNLANTVCCEFPQILRLRAPSDLARRISNACPASGPPSRIPASVRPQQSNKRGLSRRSWRADAFQRYLLPFKTLKMVAGSAIQPRFDRSTGCWYARCLLLSGRTGNQAPRWIADASRSPRRQPEENDAASEESADFQRQKSSPAEARENLSDLDLLT